VLLAVVAVAGIATNAWMEAASPLVRLAVGGIFLPYFMFFGLGVFWTRMWDKVNKSVWLALLCALIYLSIRTFNIFNLQADGIGLHLKGSALPWFGLAWSLPLSYLVLWIGNYGPAIFKTITRRIGDLSYGVYIWHLIVVNLALYLHLPEKLRALPGATQLIVIATAFVLAAFSWWFVERPMLRLKPYTSRPVTSPVLTPEAV
jgi:peptidoglycan/LPS O-acetylase OafA/YrhL